MFLGEYQTTFSGKGRIVLPRKFREELVDGKEIVLTRGLDGCIWGFESSAWLKQSEAQLAIPVTEKEGRDLRRYLFSAAEQVKLDEQGRFVIPAQLILYAGIKDKVMIIGAGDHFEVWDKKLWQIVIKEIVK